MEIWGSGPDALVFLPGLGVHPSYYRAGIERLAAWARVVLPDLSFRTHDLLFRSVGTYVTFAEALAERYAPDAPRAGHSFGGLVALMGSRPAIACAPSVPVRIRWPTVIGRALRLQLGEYAGGEGWPGVRFAARILWDYLIAAIRRPSMLFPTVSETLRGVTPRLRPACPRAHIILSREDSLYRDSEYRVYLELFERSRITVSTVDAGHDWPVTRPELLNLLVSKATACLRGGSGRPDGTGAGARPV